MPTRRSINAWLPLAAVGTAPLAACPDRAVERYQAAVAGTWRAGPLQGLEGAALGRELVRYATLAPSSHNTQCWRFAIEGRAITILPDFTRRCPAADPDDHHLFVSLGCATENLVQAARAFGLHGDVVFDDARSAVRVALSSTSAEATPWFKAITSRQCTRAVYDGQPLAGRELEQLGRAGTTGRVRVILIVQRSAIEAVLEHVVRGNTAQVNDRAFVDELRQWIRFNRADALRRGDGLYSGSSGNPDLPGWLGPRLFGLLFRAGSENDKYTRQLRSSAGVAVFVAQRDDRAHWVDVGRAYERFALEATALGVRHAHVNQPVEVPAVRESFARWLGAGSQRPDLVLRFGRGPAMPPSLRRPVEAVLA